MRHPIRTICLFAVLALSACSTVMDPTRYNQACTGDADCVPVGAGDVCSPCGCASAAVNVADVDRYRKDAESLRGWCGAQPLVLCAACQQTEGACTQGACTVRLL